ncbi:hypothetical protein GS887_26410 [Rhodococcus hoagii]|nr:hypothetical protein [Prescottella equi]MBM4719689.1 hypothetical protein [Prescottella equi]NKR23486.1 hypothetical protein [Prescottella equi]NKU37479.1 hypothetical protein [Prescottella equi]
MNNGGVRAFWIDDGPMVVFSQIGDASVADVEEAVKGAVNDVVALAQGMDVPVAESDSAMQSGMVPPPAAPPAAPSAPGIPLSR